MERVDGPDLISYMETFPLGRLPPEIARRFFAQVGHIPLRPASVVRRAIWMTMSSAHGLTHLPNMATHLADSTASATRRARRSRRRCIIIIIITAIIIIIIIILILILIITSSSLLYYFAHHRRAV